MFIYVITHNIFIYVFKTGKKRKIIGKKRRRKSIGNGVINIKMSRYC